MKRLFAVVVLLAASGVFFKLASKGPKPGQGPGEAVPGPTRVENPSTEALEAEILARYPDDRALVERTLDRYRRTALTIERTDGLRGLALLDRLDLEAIYLYEKYPNDFRRLRDCLTDDAAADLLLHWREYFGLKRADDTDRGVLIAEIARLSPAQRRAAARYPNLLPLVLADPDGIAELIERKSDDPEALEKALVILSFISLEPGAIDLRVALRTLEHSGPMALEAFRAQGLDGFALVGLYGPVLEALGDALPLDDALILLRVNTDDVDDLLATRSADEVAGYLRHIAAAGLVEPAGGSPHALRLVVEYGARGDRALAEAGPDAADVVFEDFTDPTLRRQAVEALAEHGPMALAMLDKYAPDPDFREILRDHGAAVIPPVARADAGPEALAALRSKADRSFAESLAQGVLALSGENGQAMIRTIRSDGIERAASLSDPGDLQFYQFLPLYDLLHLAGVVSRGHAPTSGEMAWALVDGCFIAADVLALSAVQPGGVVAAEAARSEAKAAVRATASTAGRELVEEAGEVAGRTLARRAAGEGAEAVAERASRWWAVRLAGGTFRILRRMPEALGRLGVAEVADLGRPLSAKLGLRLTTWEPLRFLKNGQEILLRIPPGRGLKYLGAQVAQATVGVVGFQKMEEHLASRRPQHP